MKVRMPIIAMTLILASLTSCGRQSTTNFEAGTAVDEVVAAVQTASTARMTALESGDLDGYLTAYQDDAVWMPPDSEEIVGKANARQRLQPLLDTMTFEEVSEIQELVPMGEGWASERGQFSTTLTPKKGGDSHVGVGSYLTVWHRNAAGQWKVVYEIWNSDRRRPTAEPEK